MRIEKKDIDAAVRSGILNRVQAEELWQLWQEQKEDEPRLSLSHLAYYLGVLLVMGAMGWFLTKAWLELSGLVLLCTAILYGFIFLVGGLLLRGRRGGRLPGGLAVTTAVCMTPLAVYGFLKYTGYWEAQLTLMAAGGFYSLVPQHRLWMEGATAVLSLLVARVVPFPFLLAPFVVSLWMMVQDLVPLWHWFAPWISDAWANTWLGGLLFVLAVEVDRGRWRRNGPDMACWLYLASGASLAAGLYVLSWWGLAGWPRWTTLLAASVFLLLAPLFQRSIFVVTGAVGYVGYLGYLAYEVFADSLYFPLVLSALGVLCVGAGWLYQRKAARWRAQLLGSLPGWLCKRLPPSVEE